jgi:signal transduction histidine kinase
LLELDLTTRPPEARPAPPITPVEQAELIAGPRVTAALAGSDGLAGWREIVPLRQHQQVIGAAQIEMRELDAARLTRRLRVIDTAVLVASIIAISLVLTLFLEYRVMHPVRALVNGMRRAERGQRGVQVSPQGRGEFGFLTGSFNRMLVRSEELTVGLEERVRAATATLADKNRALQAANERLWQAQLEIGQSERLAALGHVAGTLAHELGTPLNSVLGYIQLLHGDGLRADQTEKLRTAESQVRRMIETIRSVLDRTRDVPRPRAHVAIEPLVAEAVALVAGRAAARSVCVRTALAADLPAVCADAVALRQALLNLLSNALDATDEGGHVVVSAAVITMADDCRSALEIAIADEGHGMSADELRCAFQPFYTTKMPGRGTGLGLAIVEHIVRAHGGHLDVESIVGRGTTVRMRLPLEA